MWRADRLRVRVLFALLDGNYAEAERVLAASPRADFQDIDFSFYYPKAWFEAIDRAGKRRFRSSRCTLFAPPARFWRND